MCITYKRQPSVNTESITIVYGYYIPLLREWGYDIRDYWENTIGHEFCCVAGNKYNEITMQDALQVRKALGNLVVVSVKDKNTGQLRVLVECQIGIFDRLKG